MIPKLITMIKVILNIFFKNKKNFKICKKKYNYIDLFTIKSRINKRNRKF